ncbi:HAD hydrolase-like protein [Lacticaseibacillus pabuli]|uniref:HAD hydrolase-like protein n=1 Tax=Lacticaseibacillus pabuli TaxID=3025672 RepID=A0ABY7WUD8_9LACO|nr:HAD hydrolase-like protein [Lacticaseibacillus sp. KACC 23028]WDF83777.1 HAD hydrolase-like protein [Lacticaseibacillus sp. KACC 23028]
MKAVIWDFDGTLYDTYPGMIRALMATLADFQLPGDADHLLIATKRDSMKKVFDDYAKAMNPSDPLTPRAKLQSTYNGHEPVLNADPQLFPDAEAAIKAVTAQGGVNLLWTHRDERAWRLLKRDHLDQEFIGGTTIDMHFKRKPDPESLLYLIHKYQLDPTQTLVVGDRKLDSEAAKAAKCWSLYLDVDELHDAPHADYTAKDMTTALPIVQQFMAAN